MLHGFWLIFFSIIEIIFIGYLVVYEYDIEIAVDTVFLSCILLIEAYQQKKSKHRGKT